MFDYELVTKVHIVPKELVNRIFLFDYSEVVPRWLGSIL